METSGQTAAVAGDQGLHSGVRERRPEAPGAAGQVQGGGRIAGVLQGPGETLPLAPRGQSGAQIFRVMDLIMAGPVGVVVV